MKLASLKFIRRQGSKNHDLLHRTPPFVVLCSIQIHSSLLSELSWPYFPTLLWFELCFLCLCCPCSGPFDCTFSMDSILEGSPKQAWGVCRNPFSPPYHRPFALTCYLRGRYLPLPTAVLILFLHIFQWVPVLSSLPSCPDGLPWWSCEY